MREYSEGSAIAGPLTAAVVLLVMVWVAMAHWPEMTRTAKILAANQRTDGHRREKAAGQGEAKLIASAMPHSARDRDIMIRTLIGEAWHSDPKRRQPPIGARGVAHVIVNRARDGRFGGKNITRVCLAKNQFEPWIWRRKNLMRIKKTSKAYRWAAAFVGPILAGHDKDPTSGALFFLNPIVVRSRRKRGDLPRWAVGKTLTVSASNKNMMHVFYTGPKVVGWFKRIDDLSDASAQKLWLNRVQK